MTIPHEKKNLFNLTTIGLLATQMVNNYSNPLAVVAYFIAIIFKGLHDRVRPYAYGKGEYAFGSISITLFIAASWTTVVGTPSSLIYISVVQLVATIFAILEWSNVLMFGVGYFLREGLPIMTGLVPQINMFALVLPILIVMVPTIFGTVIKKGYHEFHIKGARDIAVFDFITIPLVLVVSMGEYGIIPAIAFIGYGIYNTFTPSTNFDIILREFSDGTNRVLEDSTYKTTLMDDGDYMYSGISSILLSLLIYSVTKNTPFIAVYGNKVVYNTTLMLYGLFNINQNQRVKGDILEKSFDYTDQASKDKAFLQDGQNV